MNSLFIHRVTKIETKRDTFSDFTTLSIIVTDDEGTKLELTLASQGLTPTPIVEREA